MKLKNLLSKFLPEKEETVVQEENSIKKEYVLVEKTHYKEIEAYRHELESSVKRLDAKRIEAEEYSGRAIKDYENVAEDLKKLAVSNSDLKNQLSDLNKIIVEKDAQIAALQNEITSVMKKFSTPKDDARVSELKQHYQTLIDFAFINMKSQVPFNKEEIRKFWEEKLN